MTNEQIDQMPAGPEINALIEAEIFNAIPLTDEEFKIFKATHLITNGPHSTQNIARPVKIPLDEPEYYTNLKFRLQWPSDYTSDAFGSSRKIVDKMREDKWLFTLCDEINCKGQRLSIARFNKWGKTKSGLLVVNASEGEGVAETDALAIARAALKAKLMEAKNVT